MIGVRVRTFEPGIGDVLLRRAPGVPVTENRLVKFLRSQNKSCNFPGGSASQAQRPFTSSISQGILMSHHFDTKLAKEDPSLNLCDFYRFDGAP